MRRIIALVALAGLLPLSAGCRHVGGACDCEHAINPSYGVNKAVQSGNCSSCGTSAPAIATPAEATPVAPVGYSRPLSVHSTSYKRMAR